VTWASICRENVTGQQSDIQFLMTARSDDSRLRLDARIHRLSLDKAAEQLLEECRMVLPGVQALFGFQLIAVFNAGFTDKLTRPEQLSHLAAILCVVVSIALLMAPAAIHRRREPYSVSTAFISLSSSLLRAGMAPLAAATVIDVYLVARILTGNIPAGAVVAGVCLLVFVGLWVALPARADLPRDE